MDKNADQAAGAVMMIRPVSFGFNEQTAWSNVFQKRPTDAKSINDTVNREFEALRRKLIENNIEVITVDDTPEPAKPDAIFCNNWVSFHHDGTVIMYPMMAVNRRAEKRLDVIEKFKEHGYRINRLLDLSKFEETDKYLESTGSMVIDYENRIIYACRSPRTDTSILNIVAGQLDMQTEVFNAVDKEGKPIYHTNVVMALGDRFVIICLHAIKDLEEKSRLATRLSETGHDIIEISYDQLYAFAGNSLQVRTNDGETLLVMSETAHKSLENDQVQTIEKYSKILTAPVPTIEKYGGGSVRCMMANVHLPK
jgi:hypothetical protein